ncbi:MAG: hypothetical protein M3680_09755 [Myxococcota bacterium]|nr:hypothetical protein [Myxococcota bacterium]
MMLVLGSLAACSARETKRDETAFGFDGTCVNCHAGLSAGHVHGNFKLRCVDCHGGNDAVAVPENAATQVALYRDAALLEQAHVQPKAKLARFFYANGVDDDNDGRIDETPEIVGNQVVDFGEVFEPQLHGEGAGEFFDTELSRDLNYTRFLNPGDLRVATIGCGGANRAAGESGGACHQQSIDVVRRSIMVNQAAVINGAYYGNESWRSEVIAGRSATADPRLGGFGYTLDYQGVDQCITPAPTGDPAGGRAQPSFNSACLEARATTQDPSVAANAVGNAGLPAFEIAQGNLTPAPGSVPDQTIEHTGAGHSRLPTGGNPSTGDELALMKPVPDGNLAPGIPDPVDVILRTFRAYYPLNYPGSTTNFDFTFGTSILPEIKRFKTANPYGRGHSSGCAACHAPYGFDGSRAPTRVRQDDGSYVDVVDPTTKHREFDATQDRGVVAGRDQLLGRAVTAQQQLETGRAQQKTYSLNHAMTTKVDTDTCGLCHGFVTRINLAYQGMAEEEQRDQLARRKAIEFTTPSNASVVRIVDSWVREDTVAGVVIVPEGAGVIERAKARDAALAAQGLLPGAGGCAQAVFSEDCNNNGELDTALVLTRRDEDGDVIATATINEDANANNKLDLIDRLPREKSIDGRQMRYVYGGRNGSTRQMDVHFERGMHCIDCHFLQDVHGDGHLYSTNWDAIEIECEDCHGTGTARATLVTSGPNGGNDLTRAKNDDLEPFFARTGGGILQRSRVTPGVFWRVPQTVDQLSGYAREAHSAQHVPAPGEGSTFAGMQGASKLQSAKLECAACHGSWVHNCMGCHVDLNLGDPQRKLVNAAGTIVQSAAENETWLSNKPNPAHVNFQLLGLLRSPFILGVTGTSEQGRLGTYRSSMQVHVSVTGADGHTAIDNATFTTFQTVDGNSGRTQVATSAVAMNQTMPHTVRPNEARGCETCHPLVDTADRVRNEHLLAQTYGLGTGAFPYVGDWAIAAGTNGLELFEHKQENELAANIVGRSNRFPGMIINPAGRVTAKVEPVLDGSNGMGAGAVATDVVLVRNFNPTPVAGQVEAPTLRDLAVVTVDIGGNAGRLLVTDISGRGHPASVPQSVGNTGRNFTLTLPAAPRAVAHLSPDVSDPFVYVAVGTAGITVVELREAPATAVTAAAIRTTVALQSGRTATDVVLAGDMLYVGTAQGTVEAYSLSNPALPTFASSISVGSPVNDLVVNGFLLYAATPGGIAVLSLDDPATPRPPRGASAVQLVGAVPANGIAVSEGRVYIAAGAMGVFELDLRTPGDPGTLRHISSQLAPGQPVNVNDVVLSKLPGQTWVLALDVTGDLWGLKLDNKQSTRERCFPDPGASDCILDLQFMDPTVMGRDPSFDPVTGTFDAAAVDPSAVTFFRQTRTLLTAGRRLARPASWDQLGSLTGRRVRDSFMPGAGVLSLEVMQKMRGVTICEVPGTTSTNPSGLGALGYATGSTCTPFTGNGQGARVTPTCGPAVGWGGAASCPPAAGPPLATSR